MPLQPWHAESAATTALEDAASFGRWWVDPALGQVALSVAAARLLGLQARHHERLEDCLAQVVPDDVDGPLQLLRGIAHLVRAEVEFRVVDTVAGMRWLRATRLPPEPGQPGLVCGLLLDTTPLRMAAARERLGFELTEYLVGTHALDDAIVSVIQLICRNLGWEWGAYWALEQSPEAQPRLACPPDASPPSLGSHPRWPSPVPLACAGLQ